MVNPLICGISSFNHQLEEDEDKNSPCSTPRKSRKSSLLKKRESKNPYASRGLDKFSALLAEVEDKKQRIYTQIPADDISLVRFTYSDANSIRPIVIRARDRKPDKSDSSIEITTKDETVQASQNYPTETLSMTNSDEAKQGRGKSGLASKMMEIDFRKPSVYLTVIFIFILILLTLFGRSFTILCASMGWYLLPSVKKMSSNSKGAKRKREKARKASDKKLVRDWLSLDKNHLAGAPVDDTSPPRHWTSW